MQTPVALITGAATGIGYAFADRLGARGYNLILVGRRRDRLEAAAAELAARHNVEAEPFAADLTHEGQLATVEQRIRKAANLEVLVNDAGFGTLGRFLNTELDGQDRMHRLHVMATLHLTHAALPGMVARGKGAIVNVSSVAAFAHSAGNVSYCATKAWVNSFTEGLHLELKSMRSPVRVQALCPGFTLTEFHDVLGMDRSVIPRGLWLKAIDVVDASLRGIEADQVIVIPGWRYRFFVAMLGLLPAPLRRSIAMGSGRRLKRDVVPPLPPSAMSRPPDIMLDR